MALTLSFFSYLGQTLLIVALSSGLAWWLFRTFGERWISSKFEKQLETFRHKNQTELENTRFEFNKLMDRSIKLHQLEFEVLPELWRLLVVATGKVSQSVSQVQTYANLDRMLPDHLDEFLEGSELENWQKQALRSSKSKNEYYQDAVNWIRLTAAQNAQVKFNNFRLLHSIFLNGELQESLAEFSKLLNSALTERQMEIENPKSRSIQRDAITKFSNEVDKSLKNVEDQIVSILSVNSASAKE